MAPHRAPVPMTAPPAALEPLVDHDPPAAPVVARRRFAFALCSTFAALPLVVIDNLPGDTGANRAEVVEVEATTDPVEAAAPVTVARLVAAPVAPPPTTVPPPTTTPPAAAPPTTTPSTAPPTTAAPPTTTEVETTPAPPPAPAPVTPPPTVAAAAPPPAPPPTAAPPPANQDSGGASWYRHQPGGCAHRTLAFGTVVTVVAAGSGATTTCRVNDRGPFIGGRVIDLDVTVFEQIAPLGAGVITVTISW